MNHHELNGLASNLTLRSGYCPYEMRFSAMTVSVAEADRALV